MSEPKTLTLEAPGAVLHYDVRDNGGAGHPVLLLAGAPMGASGFAALAEQFAGTEQGVAEENIQARIRGNLWMALSNKFGWLVLTAGNKSEMSVGYATLYGDMAGGFAVIKDVPKTLVYELAEWRNTQSLVIPEDAITRPPTAELRPDQKDTDSLPPYPVLDPILKAYVEEDRRAEEIVELGELDPEQIITPGVYVDRVVARQTKGPDDDYETLLQRGKEKREKEA